EDLRPLSYASNIGRRNDGAGAIAQGHRTKACARVEWFEADNYRARVTCVVDMAIPLSRTGAGTRVGKVQSGGAASEDTRRRDGAATGEVEGEGRGRGSAKSHRAEDIRIERDLHEAI